MKPMTEKMHALLSGVKNFEGKVKADTIKIIYIRAGYDPKFVGTIISPLKNRGYLLYDKELGWTVTDAGAEALLCYGK